MTGHGLMAWDTAVRKMRPILAGNVILSLKLLWTLSEPQAAPWGYPMHGNTFVMRNLTQQS